MNSPALRTASTTSCPSCRLVQLEFAIQDGVERIARTALFEYQLPGSWRSSWPSGAVASRSSSERSCSAYLAQLFERHGTLLRNPAEVLVDELHSHRASPTAEATRFTDR